MKIQETLGLRAYGSNMKVLLNSYLVRHLLNRDAFNLYIASEAASCSILGLPFNVTAELCSRGTTLTRYFEIQNADIYSWFIIRVCGHSQ